MAPERKHASHIYSSNIIAKYATGMVFERFAHMSKQFKTESTYSVGILLSIVLLFPDLASYAIYIV